MTPRAIVLGSGTSNGVPNPARAYSEDFLANPKNHRTRSSMVLCGPQGNVLVDCSPELRIQLLREQIRDLAACIITHTHADHIMGMDDLRSFCTESSGRSMPIFTSPEYQQDIRRVFSYAFEAAPPGVWVPRFDLQDVTPVLELAGLTVRTFWVDHGPTMVLGLRCNDFAYLTDVNRIPSEARRHLDGLDALVMDAVRIKPHPNHFHLAQAIEVAQEIGAKHTYFTHLSDEYDHDRTNAELPPGIQLAYDGLEIPL